MVLSGISGPFGQLSRIQRAGYPRVTHPCATLLHIPKDVFLVRLACVKHAASVRSEPGSNSPVILFNPINVHEHSAIQFSKINGGNYEATPPLLHLTLM